MKNLLDTDAKQQSHNPAAPLLNLAWPDDQVVWCVACCQISYQGQIVPKTNARYIEGGPPRPQYAHAHAGAHAVTRMRAYPLSCTHALQIWVAT